jgi:osmotically-inducible protein OsmY
MKTCSRIARVAAVIVLALAAGCSTLPCPNDGTQAAKDCNLANEITLRLQEDAVTGNYTFSVNVENGVATVQGIVPDFSIGGRVISVVRGTPGVTDVVNKLLMR